MSLKMEVLIHFEDKDDPSAVGRLVGFAAGGADDLERLLHLFILQADQKGGMAAAQETAGRGDGGDALFRTGEGAGNGGGI